MLTTTISQILYKFFPKAINIAYGKKPIHCNEWAKYSISYEFGLDIYSPLPYSLESKTIAAYAKLRNLIPAYQTHIHGVPIRSLFANWNTAYVYDDMHLCRFEELTRRLNCTNINSLVKTFIKQHSNEEKGLLLPFFLKLTECDCSELDVELSILINEYHKQYVTLTKLYDHWVHMFIEDSLSQFANALRSACNESSLKVVLLLTKQERSFFYYNRVHLVPNTYVPSNIIDLDKDHLLLSTSNIYDDYFHIDRCKLKHEVAMYLYTGMHANHVYNDIQMNIVPYLPSLLAIEYKGSIYKIQAVSSKESSTIDMLTGLMSFNRSAFRLKPIHTIEDAIISLMLHIYDNDVDRSIQLHSSSVEDMLTEVAFYIGSQSLGIDCMYF